MFGFNESVIITQCPLIIRLFHINLSFLIMSYYCIGPKVVLPNNAYLLCFDKITGEYNHKKIRFLSHKGFGRV